ncbi:hypothetical protein HYFRA_00011038 [Hymenoscyphus fraxineus]|uniref:Uncharacterized protein n=1 Tax=Hymenoscyphus fraxineus TaxID=746836 RepID=A0A9N9L1Y3_9HELO|nr:hypothetical protein HYFRA_00011038 [Hymenoscyphus fraxineus]
MDSQPNTFDLLVQFTKAHAKRLRQNNVESAKAYEDLVILLRSTSPNCEIYRVSDAVVLKCPSDTARQECLKRFDSCNLKIVGQSVTLCHHKIEMKGFWFPVHVHFREKATKIKLPDNISSIHDAYMALASEMKRQPQISQCQIIAEKGFVTIHCPSSTIQKFYRKRYNGASIIICRVSFELKAENASRVSVEATVATEENERFIEELNADIKLLLQGSPDDSEMRPKIPDTPSISDLQKETQLLHRKLDEKDVEIASLREQLSAADKAQTLLREKLEKAESANRKVAAPRNPENDAMEESSTGNKRRRVETVEENAEARGIISQPDSWQSEQSARRAANRANAIERGIFSDPNGWRPGQPPRLPPGTPRNPPDYVRTYRKITQEECEIPIPDGHDMFRHESGDLFWMPAGIFGLDYEYE